MNILSKSALNMDSKNKLESDKEELGKLYKFLEFQKKAGKKNSEIKELLIKKGLDEETATKVLQGEVLISTKDNHCIECGKKSDSNAKFCNSCGAGLMTLDIREDAQQAHHEQRLANRTIIALGIVIGILLLFFALKDMFLIMFE